jgi:two-component system, LytTR family, response regulator
MRNLPPAPTLNSKIRALIADDEAFARDYLRRMLSAHENVEIVAVCSDGSEASEMIRKQKPNVVFLDVHMPVMTGIEALDGLAAQDIPLVVFCTAHDEYALTAFDYEAADYLLKPFDAERLRRTLSRVRSRLMAIASTGERSAQEPEPPPEYFKRIVVKLQERLHVVLVDDVQWVEADDKTSILHTARGKYPLRKPIKELESHLDPKRFMRVHRSYLIALGQVRELHPLPDGDYGIVLHDGTVITLSRTYRDAFFERLRA